VGARQEARGVKGGDGWSLSSEGGPVCAVYGAFATTCKSRGGGPRSGGTSLPQRFVGESFWDHAVPKGTCSPVSSCRAQSKYPTRMEIKAGEVKLHSDEKRHEGGELPLPPGGARGFPRAGGLRTRLERSGRGRLTSDQATTEKGGLKESSWSGGHEHRPRRPSLALSRAV